MMKMKVRKLLIGSSAVLFCLTLSAFSLYAQITNTTPPPNDDVVVISRADDFSSDNSPIISNQTNEREMRSLEEKIDAFNLRLKELGVRINTIESSKETAYDVNQKRLLLNLDILSKAETRAQNLRQQLIELVEKESEIKTKMEKIEYDLRPEMIDRMVAFAGTLRPEEIRELRRRTLETEKNNLQNLLFQIQSNKSDLELNVQKADLLVEKLRNKLEAEIDKALAETPDP